MKSFISLDAVCGGMSLDCQAEVLEDAGIGASTGLVMGMGIGPEGMAGGFLAGGLYSGITSYRSHASDPRCYPEQSYEITE